MIEQLFKSILFSGILALIIGYYDVMPAWGLWILILAELWIGEWYFEKKQ
jgi:hypothetical protein